ncbi:MAG: hypothetical protein AMXMBFR12_06110 [Candidatus Babeliales bacterium]
MKMIFACATLMCRLSCGMEEYTKIKELLGNSNELKTYLESQDQYQNTPLMKFFNSATDAQIQEILPLLKSIPFNTEVQGISQETAFFNACDRPGILAASLMLSLGCQIDASTPAGRPVYLAFFNDNLALLKLLIEEGANPQIPPEIVTFAAQKPDFQALKATVTKQRIA